MIYLLAASLAYGLFLSALISWRAFLRSVPSSVTSFARRMCRALKRGTIPAQRKPSQNN